MASELAAVEDPETDPDPETVDDIDPELEVEVEEAL